MNIPNCAHELDREWIQEQLNKLPPQMRVRAVEGYQGVFDSAYQNEPVSHKKSNAGRRSANLRLRLFVDKFYKAAMGHTIQPPVISK